MKTRDAFERNDSGTRPGERNKKKSRAIVASLCFVALVSAIAIPTFVKLRMRDSAEIAPPSKTATASGSEAASSSETAVAVERNTALASQDSRGDRQQRRESSSAPRRASMSATRMAQESMARVKSLETPRLRRTSSTVEPAVEALSANPAPPKSESIAAPSDRQETVSKVSGPASSGASSQAPASNLSGSAAPPSQTDEGADKDFGFVALLNKTELNDELMRAPVDQETAAPQKKGPDFRTEIRRNSATTGNATVTGASPEPALQDPSPASKVEISYPAPVAPAEFNGDVRSLPQIVTPEERSRFRFELELEGPEPSEAKKPLPGAEQETAPQPEASTPVPGAPMPAPLQSFPGLTFASNGAGWPPDTVGDVGPNHFVQAVNTSVGIYNKTGTQLAAFTFNTLWTGSATGTACDASHQGDPTVIYSRLYNRWIVADFAFTGATIQNGPYFECIAVSKTPDPVAGGWWLFAYRADDAAHPWLPDYPKMGLWPDGLYMTANMFDCLNAACSSATYKEVRAYAFNMLDLTTGAALRSVVADTNSANIFTMLPSNYRGAAPPAGRENLLVSESATLFAWEVWKFHVDYSGAGSTFTGPTNVSQTSYTGATGSVTSPGNSLDSLAERMMMQNQYRNVAGVESLWVNHTVRTGIAPAPNGIQWGQINVTGGVITTPPVQQQIYGNIGADLVHRWMGALGVDNQGNMALAYNASSTTLNPDIRYAGRLLADPLNTLPQTETTMLPGVTRATQSGTCAGSTCTRWGDYSAMSVDPTDECTFWFTTEYYETTSNVSWRTRIGSFKFPTCISNPTLAKVNSFTASAFDDGRVSLKWNSAYESDNLGYNVYREVNGRRIKVNSQIIAGSALTTGLNVALTAGKAYDWADQLTAGASPRYWLEDIDTRGNSSWNGPISLDKKSGKAPTIDQSLVLGKIGMAQSQMTLGQGSIAVERKAGIASLTPAAMQVQSNLAGQASAKLTVKQVGWYRASQRDLVNAGFSAKVDPRKLQLYVDGRPVPIIVNGEKDGKFDQADSVEFYGIGIDSPVTDAHLYWLAAGTQPGTRIPAPQASAHTPGASSFQSSVERKDRTVYFSALKNGDAENFFGPVIGSSPVDQSLSVTNLSTAPPGSASLEVAVQGVTAVAHQVKVMLNGAEVGTISFSGQTRAAQTFAVPQSSLRDGVNSLELASLGGSGDISLADSARVTYWHSYRADSNQLQLTAQGGQQVTLSGFTSNSVRVMDVTDPNSPQELLPAGGIGKGDSSIVTVNVPGAGKRELYAFADAQSRTPDVKLNTASSWRQPGRRADLVIFTRRELMSSLAPLVSLRQKDGLAVAVVDVEDACDEFSFGNKTPQAMRDLLQFAKSNWQLGPRFVLLAGDASYDSKNYLGYGDSDIVPTRLIDTQHMQAASDDWFSDFNNSGAPQMATGRLPVRNAAEASALVAKITGYDGSRVPNSILLASDSFDGFDFASANDQVRPLVPVETQVTEVRRDSGDDATVKAKLLASINSGAKIVNYHGHGAMNQWRGSILTSDDARNLSNGKNLSLFVMMTCLNGFFDDPALESLSESLMKASNGGAIAVWASTAQADPTAQAALNLAFYRALFGSTQMTVGEAASRAKSSVTDGDVRRTWILFGDPSMRLK